MNFFSRHTAHQFTKFLGVGALSTLVNYGTFFLLLQWFLVHYLLAAVAGYVIGVMLGFSLNRSWTFPSSEAKKRRELLVYVLVYSASLLGSIILLKALVGYAFMHPLLANVFSIGFSTVTNFLGCKYFVFHRV